MIYPIKCPYCTQEIDTADWIESFTSDGDEFTETCPHCKEEIEVVADVDIEFTVKK